MIERAAHAVDAVLPPVPVRQWVLGLPHRLRYVLAWDHGLCRAVLAAYVRALLAFQRRRARRLGVRAGQTGTLTVIQRFGNRRSYCDLLHEQSLDRLLRAVQSRNGAARRSSLAAVLRAVADDVGADPDDTLDRVRSHCRRGRSVASARSNGLTRTARPSP